MPRDGIGGRCSPASADSLHRPLYSAFRPPGYVDFRRDPPVLLSGLLSDTHTKTLRHEVSLFKREGELAERMCGMANAQRGLIIIGVEDTSLKIVGVPDARMTLTHDMVLRAARQIDLPLLLDPAGPEVYQIDGKKVVVATIPPNRGPLYQASGVCWIRRGTHTIPLSVSEMLELANDRGLQDWELLLAGEWDKLFPSGFRPLPRRWVIERSFAWITRQRCTNASVQSIIARCLANGK